MTIQGLAVRIYFSSSIGQDYKDSQVNFDSDDDYDLKVGQVERNYPMVELHKLSTQKRGLERALEVVEHMAVCIDSSQIRCST